MPLMFLGLVRWLDLYGTGKFGFNVVTLVWGLVAYILAAKINPWMLNAGWITRSQVVRITAPIVEEILKALILIYLVQRSDFNYVVDGAIYGFGAGIGFAVIENYEYVMGHSTIAVSVAITRVFSTNLIHATGSGIIGTALAYLRGENSWRGWLVALLGYAFAIGFHMTFNTLVSSGIALLVAIAIGLAGLGIIWFVIRRGLNTQKQWLGEKLNDIDRATKQETRALTQVEDIQKVLLTPFEEKFGSEKTKLVQRMLLKQAEIGIKRKLLESTQSEEKRKEIELIIEEVKQEVNGLRLQLGSRCMTFVRIVYQDQSAKVFGLINARIAESSTGQKGGGLWDRASNRIQSSKPQEDKSNEQ